MSQDLRFSISNAMFHSAEADICLHHIERRYLTINGINLTNVVYFYVCGTALLCSLLY